MAYTVPGRERDDQLATKERQRADRDDQSGVRSTREPSDVVLDPAGVTHIDRRQLHPE
jgi:hypothetical protein